MQHPSFDIVIIGGGVIGSAIAYFLSCRAGFGDRIAIVERDPSYTGASSSLSASGLRQQFGTAPNIAMSAASRGFLREAHVRLAIGDEAASIGLHEAGYLILGRADQVAGFEARHAVQRAAGVAVELIRPPALHARFPGLVTDDLAIASLGRAGEGWFDGPALHQAFRRRARAQGVVTLTDDAVALDRSGGHIEAVRLRGGERLACGTVVNAAGAWSGTVARLAGIEIPIVPRKRCVFVIASPAAIPGGHFVHDPGGVWVRQEGKLFLCGTTPRTENADDDFGLDVDHDIFDALIWPALAHRIPAFEELRLLRAWAGLYDYNCFDHSAIIGRHPDIPNFVLATGFSGHGMMHSAAAGLGVSELIADGSYRTLDLAPFGVERIAANAPIPEHVY